MSEGSRAERKLQRLTEAAKKLAVRPRVQFKELMKILEDIHQRDKTAFRQVAKDIGLSQRTAYYLLGIAKKIKDHPERERLERLGWTKLKLLVPHIGRANFRPYLSYAGKHTAEECRRHFQKEDTSEKTRCTLLRFKPDDYAIFYVAIIRAGGKKRGKGLVGTEAALLKIIASTRAK